MDVDLAPGTPIRTVDEREAGHVDGPPFEGPAGARFFVLRTPGEVRLLVPVAAILERGTPEHAHVSLPAAHLATLPVAPEGEVDEPTARRALAALGGRQGFVGEAVERLAGRADDTPIEADEAGFALRGGEEGRTQRPRG